MERCHLYNVDKGGAAARSYLFDVHRLTRSGPRPIGSKRKRGDVSTAEQLSLDTNNPEDQQILNKIALLFNHNTFKRLLIRWVVSNNVAFTMMDSESFRKLIIYLQPRLEGSLPGRTIVRSWIIDEFAVLKQLVIAELRKAQGLIHICFDLWTSRNLLSLNRIVVHYAAADNTSKTFLLALPEQQGSHSGANIVDTVAAIIEDFGI